MEYLRPQNILFTFDRVFSAALILIYLSLMPNYGIYFGEHTYFQVPKVFHGKVLPFALDILTYHPDWGVFVYAIFLFCCTLIVAGWSHFSIRLVRFFTLFWLHQGLWTISDGGMNLAVLTSLYMCLFGLPLAAKKRTVLEINLLRLLKYQVILIYVTAFISKMTGNLWLGGEALGYIVQVDKFRSDFLLSLFRAFPFLDIAMTRGVVLAQCAIALLLINRQPNFRLSAILIGTGLHIGIAIHMGLIGFSLIMIVHYILFLPNRWREKIRKLFQFPRSIIGGLLFFGMIGWVPNIGLAEQPEVSSLIILRSSSPSDNIIVDYASLSKLFTLALVDQLIQKNILSLSDQVLTSSGKYKLRDLLTFTAGIQDLPIRFEDIPTFEWEQWDRYYKNGNVGETYSNFSYVLVQKLIEQKLGQSFKDLIFKELGLAKLGIRPKNQLSSQELLQKNLSPNVFSSKTLGAFGLIGPIKALKVLRHYFSSRGFCIGDFAICVTGISDESGYYFSGTHGQGLNHLMYLGGELFFAHTEGSVRHFLH